MISNVLEYFSTINKVILRFKLEVVCGIHLAYLNNTIYHSKDGLLHLKKCLAKITQGNIHIWGQNSG